MRALGRILLLAALLGIVGGVESKVAADAHGAPFIIKINPLGTDSDGCGVHEVQWSNGDSSLWRLCP